ncbi:MAG: [FeFe] hydrogenase H-cluster radical SAM maturase HydE [Candidatus Omnitrophica bacterium]|nr:[FeFe] hydrogenase H-cluster radical SAM maturase HydE [Candidatus Omnitrophota bacterium]
MKLNRDKIIEWLRCNNQDQLKLLYQQAYDVKLHEVGPKVYLRGLIELSNICIKNCLYCGIRSSNSIPRYELTEGEVLSAARFAHEEGYGSIVLQSGERQDHAFIENVDRLLKGIKIATSNQLGITLSLGEQSFSTYKKWFNSGAHRYLLRIETTNQELYQRIHPDGHDFDQRKSCLKDLKKIGYQVGTGVMIGLPWQTVDDLVNDLLYYDDQDIDMIGMGPYLPHRQSPLQGAGPVDLNRNFEWTLKMIALSRIFLRDVNIAATTALQTIHFQGREWGIKAGANVIMPNVTPMRYRQDYQLYDDKPCLNDDASLSADCLASSMHVLSVPIGYKEWGDAPHYHNRMKDKPFGPICTDESFHADK